MNNTEMENLDSRDDTLTNNSRGINSGYISSENILFDFLSFYSEQ